MPNSESENSNCVNNYSCFDDPLYLSPSDQPTLQLVSVQFNGTGFISWKRDVYIALIAKNKDGFINGTFKQPSKEDKKHHQWIHCDYIVVKWILNSLTRDIRETVEYARSAKDLWCELKERYGQVNTVELYQLRKELSDTTQSNAPLVEYYSKLKRTWETQDSLDPIPICTCGAMDKCFCKLLKRMLDRESGTKLLQFLMGLNSSFENVKTNALTMEPLPPLNKAFSLLQKVERQKQVSEAVDILAETIAYAVNSGSKRPKLKSETGEKYCTHCKKKRHEIQNCHKLKTCSHCGKKGRVFDYCYFNPNSKNRFNKNKDNFRGGKPPDVHYHSGANVYRRTANNVDAFPDQDLAESTSLEFDI